MSGGTGSGSHVDWQDGGCDTGAEKRLMAAMELSVQRVFTCCQRQAATVRGEWCEGDHGEEQNKADK